MKLQRPNTTRGESGKSGSGPRIADADDFLVKHLPGTSAAVVNLRDRVAQLNSSRNIELIRSILILGETGAGKNHLARVISGHRRWRAIANASGDPGLEAGLGPFCDHFAEIPLPGVPEELIESELFGHKRGAFTGALNDKLGLLASDRVDDVLLDEIGDISLAFQAKLLGLLDHRRFRPVGRDLNEEERMSARLLMATNRPLRALVAKGKFREDLYHRARLFVVTVPALRDQPENLEGIARELEADIRRRLGEDIRKDAPKGLEANRSALSDADIEWARGYDWPGNVRELRDAITRWFFEEGRRTLQQIVQDLRDEETPGEPPAQWRATLANLVIPRLDGALRTGAPAANTLSEFVKDFENETKAAMSDWYKVAKPGDDALRLLFPGHGQAQSIRNKLSKWKRP